MKIQVRVKTGSGKQEIESFGDQKNCAQFLGHSKTSSFRCNRYLVYLESAPENNEANIELIKLMAKHLGIPSTKLRIVSGATGKDKTLEVV